MAAVEEENVDYSGADGHRGTLPSELDLGGMLYAP